MPPVKRTPPARDAGATALRAAVEGAIETLAQAVVIVDASSDETPIVYVNRAFEELTGYSVAEVLNRNASFLDGPDTDPATIAEIKRALATGEPFAGELACYRKDGSSFWSAVRISPVVDESGTITHYISIHTDETKRKELEERFLQAQKMEAVGRLAGGVAHEFNNVLLVIRGYSHVLMSMLRESGPGWAEAREIEAASSRATELIQRLLAFSRTRAVATRVCHLNEIVQQTETVIEPLIGDHIEVEVELARDLAPVKADPAHIEQALVNLVVNARDAMPDGGKLGIRTANIFVEQRRHHVALAPGRYATLTVADTGFGMDAETRARIFEPFFSTKDEATATGLGLSTVYGIVKQAGGDITVVSGPNAGTTFTIFLPQTTAVPASRDTPAQRHDGARESETVLLVEDNETARTLLGRLLREGGYRVHEAALPDAALEFCAEHDGGIDLLLSDVVMPQMNGPVLARHVLARRPDTRVIFVSGYVDHADVSAGDAFLQKPFTPDELLEAVRRVLDVEEPVASAAAADAGEARL